MTQTLSISDHHQTTLVMYCCRVETSQQSFLVTCTHNMGCQCLGSLCRWCLAK